MKDFSVIIPYIIIAAAMIPAVVVPLLMISADKRSGKPYLLLPSVLVFILSGYWIYKGNNALGWVLATCNSLVVYYMILTKITIFILNKNKAGEKRITDSPLWINLIVMIIIANACGYLGYVIAGGKTSFGIIIGIFITGLLILFLLGWLQFGRKENQIELMKSNIKKRIDELNSYEDE